MLQKIISNMTFSIEMKWNMKCMECFEEYFLVCNSLGIYN